MSNHAEGADGSRKARSTHLFEAEGHLLGVRPSTIPGAGRGLFLLKGNIKTGEVGSYPFGARNALRLLRPIASSRSNHCPLMSPSLHRSSRCTPG